MARIDPALESLMVDWRHQLHRHPEPGFEEKYSSDFIAKKLQSFGIEVIRDLGKTGLVGILKKGDSSQGIGLRADMDALQIHEMNTFDYRSEHDGLMHACGHDGHSAMLLGAAKILSESGQFNGSVYFIFQPDEEHGKGAKAMISDGLFEKFSMDSVYGLHNMPGLEEGMFAVRPGPIMASESNFEIRLEGKGGHAALPHMGSDVMLLGAEVVVALQSIVSRKLSSLHEPAVLSVTEFVTDGTVNVIPSTVTIKGDCRCFTQEVLEKIEFLMRQIVSGLCDAGGVKFDFDFYNSFLSTINSEIETQHTIKAAIDIFGEDNVIPNCDPYTVSEDFSSMLQVKPGCYGLIGNGINSTGGCALHNPNYDFNDGILVKGASYWTSLVEHILPVDAGSE